MALHFSARLNVQEPQNQAGRGGVGLGFQASASKIFNVLERPRMVGLRSLAAPWDWWWAHVKWAVFAVLQQLVSGANESVVWKKVNWTAVCAFWNGACSAAICDVVHLTSPWSCKALLWGREGLRAVVFLWGGEPVWPPFSNFTPCFSSFAFFSMRITPNNRTLTACSSFCFFWFSPSAAYAVTVEKPF